MKTLIFTSSVLAASLLAACNPYAPDLGNAPFRCGTAEPRCPDGYACKAYSADLQVCEAGDSSVDARPGDASPLVCNNDQALEPNDSLGNARAIPAKPIGMPFKYAGVAICPSTDKDIYSTQVDTIPASPPTFPNPTQPNLEVVVDFSTGAPLSMAILNSGGTSVVTGTVTGSQIKAKLANAASGVWYVQVLGTGNNNYDITITQTR